MKLQKTNAVRLLDNAKIEYQLIPYEVDESDLSATHVAEQLNEPVEQLFKTLVLKGDKNGYFVCIIPSNKEVNLKIAAKASENKSCSMIPMKDLLSITGYIRGACSPIGMKRKFPIFIDFSASNFDNIYVSAGVRGTQLKISPNDLISITEAKAYGLCSE